MRRFLPWVRPLLLLALAPFPATSSAAQSLDALKGEVRAEVDGMRQFTQQAVDQIFSFGELGFQEEETSRYLVRVLREQGFTVEEGVDLEQLGIAYPTLRR